MCKEEDAMATAKRMQEALKMEEGTERVQALQAASCLFVVDEEGEPSKGSGDGKVVTVSKMLVSAFCVIYLAERPHGGSAPRGGDAYKLTRHLRALSMND